MRVRTYTDDIILNGYFLNLNSNYEMPACAENRLGGSEIFIAHTHTHYLFSCAVIFFYFCTICIILRVFFFFLKIVLAFNSSE